MLFSVPCSYILSCIIFIPKGEEDISLEKEEEAENLFVTHYISFMVFFRLLLNVFELTTVVPWIKNFQFHKDEFNDMIRGKVLIQSAWNYTICNMA